MDVLIEITTYLSHHSSIVYFIRVEEKQIETELFTTQIKKVTEMRETIILARRYKPIATQ